MSGYIYLCSAGETFDGVARAIWGDVKYAPDLLCANPEYSGKMVFDGGEELYVPQIDIQDETVAVTMPDKAPWRE